MNDWPATLLLLILAFLGVFAEAVCDLPRRWLGAQLNLLPPLVVCAALRLDVLGVSLLCAWGGVLTDSLSGNPLGVSVLPLIWVGLVIRDWRDVLLGRSTFAQGVLGGLATVASTLVTLALLFTLGERPLLAWDSLWQLLAVSAGGVLLTPVACLILDQAERLFAYRPVAPPSFRPDREIKRGRT
jgi:rod shape-determining protein MreD